MICPACQSSNTEQLFDVGLHPMSLVDLQHDRCKSRFLKRHSIRLHICKFCSHVFNVDFDPSVVTYSQEGCRMYNQGEGWQEHVKFVRSMVENLEEADCIIEIGAGDCEFLASINTEAIKVAVDPCEAVERAEEFGIVYHREYFDPSRHLPSDSKAAVIMMRHLLEHMENPREFIEGIVEHAKRNVQTVCLMIEVPCCENALKNGRIEDWTYEHPQNFTLQSMRRLLRNCGMEQFSVMKSYGGEVLVVQAFVVPDRDKGVEDIIDRYRKIHIGLCRAGDHLRRNSDKVAYWGGAGKSAMFLRKFGVPDDAIVVDSHEEKFGFFVPGTSIMIRSPEYLKCNPVEDIIVTTSWRADDIRDDIKRRNISCNRILKFENGDLVEVPLG